MKLNPMTEAPKDHEIMVYFIPSFGTVVAHKVKFNTQTSYLWLEDKANHPRLGEALGWHDLPEGV